MLHTATLCNTLCTSQHNKFSKVSCILFDAVYFNSKLTFWEFLPGCSGWGMWRRCIDVRRYIDLHVGVCCVGTCTVCCNVLQCDAVWCSVLQCVATCCSALQCVAVCCSVLQCVAVCCSMMQCVTVCRSAFVVLWRLEGRKRTYSRESARERENAREIESVCLSARERESESEKDREWEQERERSRQVGLPWM